MGRRDLWKMMEDVQEQFSGPLLAAGDFNVISSVSEWSGGAPPNGYNMEEFNKAIFNCGLSDVGFDGSPFTWTNGEVWKRLDRALANETLTDLFEVTKVSQLLQGRFDHTPLLIKCGANRLRSSSFRFLNVWTKHSSFKKVVQEAWLIPISKGGQWIEDEESIKDSAAHFYAKLFTSEREARADLILNFSLLTLSQEDNEGLQ
ncbi:uncharacterized protein [Coffea arabica]|uniref:Endonuclease/exonuclease/phosphatase domain-containing protein n=1 Tax=Coffea arabica TaxID=13443 RepID=A0ABM4WQ18_COFAR